MEYVWLANFTGCPAISCPAGYSPDSGVPIGVMAMGEWGTEEDLIAFARDGEPILDLPSSAPSLEESGISSASKGLRTPSDASVWEDIIAQTKSK
jgi:amidase